MPGFTSFDALSSAITISGQVVDFSFVKTPGQLPATAGSWVSFWTIPGVPASGVDTSFPGPSGSAVTNAEGGFVLSNTSPLTKHLLSFGGQASNVCSIMIYDRLWCASGFQTTSATPLAVGTGTLPRSSGGVGVQCWVEFTSGSTAGFISLSLSSYTNENGNTGRSGSTWTMPTSALLVRYAVPLPLGPGDLGIRSVEALNISVTGNGTFNVVLLRPLAHLPIPMGNVWFEKDFIFQTTNLNKIDDGATLGMMILANATGAVNIHGTLKVVYG